MLPYPTDPDFPAALKARREALGLSRSALARLAGIHGVMPRRYEDPTCRDFARPRLDTTWADLNKALGYTVQSELQGEMTQSADPEKSSSSSEVSKALTLMEAKAGLAITFGVDIDRIEITIRC